MDAAIDQKRAQCRHCNVILLSNDREALCPSPEPEYPWQHAVADYFAWIELYKMDGKVVMLNKRLRNLFAQMGVLVELASVGGQVLQHTTLTGIANSGG